MVFKKDYFSKWKINNPESGGYIHMFGKDSYAKIWKITDNGKYSTVELSTSKKNREGEYETDFSSKFVRFVGKAHTLAAQLNGNEKIRLGSCGVTNKFDKERQKAYTNFIVFDFELVDGKEKKDITSKNADSGDIFEEELPF